MRHLKCSSREAGGSSAARRQQARPSSRNLLSQVQVSNSVSIYIAREKVGMSVADRNLSDRETSWLSTGDV